MKLVSKHAAYLKSKPLLGQTFIHYSTNNVSIKCECPPRNFLIPNNDLAAPIQHIFDVYPEYVNVDDLAEKFMIEDGEELRELIFTLANMQILVVN